jgi:hypothetical protein
VARDRDTVVGDGKAEILLQAVVEEETERKNTKKNQSDVVMR